MLSVRIRHVLAAAVTLMMAVPIMPTSAQTAARRTITVSGEGDVSAAPNLADVSIGVTTEGPNAAAALQSNSQALTGVLDTLRKEGLQPRDLQTSGLSLQPRFETPQPGRAPKTNGYQATNMLMVRVRDIAKLGSVLDKAVASGATDIRGIQFGIANTTELQDEARKKAMEDAGRKAALFAAAGNVKVSALQSVEEEAGGGFPQPRMALAAAKANAAVPIEAGEISVSARVRVVYEISD